MNLQHRKKQINLRKRLDDDIQDIKEEEITRKERVWCRSGRVMIVFITLIFYLSLSILFVYKML